MKSNGDPGLVLIKYGGNAMLNDELTGEILEKVGILSKDGYRVVIVHGGGPFIEENLKTADIESDFVEGHRRTTSDAMKYIEMTLKGHVNSKLVRMLNARGMEAVGLSGKDAGMVKVSRRQHKTKEGENVDIGFVGDVSEIRTDLLDLLLANNYIAVVSPIATGPDNQTYNVNADMFAGNLAGALKAKHFVMLTDVDGLMENPEKPETLIKTITPEDVDKLRGKVIKGGMIPKTEACKIAVEKGAHSAIITNGTKPEWLISSIQDIHSAQGTVLHNS